MLILSSCVSSKKYNESQASLAEARQKYRGDSAFYAQKFGDLDKSVRELEERKATLQNQIEAMNNEIDSINRQSASQQGLLGEQ